MGAVACRAQCNTWTSTAVPRTQEWLLRCLGHPLAPPYTIENCQIPGRTSLSIMETSSAKLHSGMCIHSAYSRRATLAHLRAERLVIVVVFLVSLQRIRGLDVPTHCLGARRLVSRQPAPSRHLAGRPVLQCALFLMRLQAAGIASEMFQGQRPARDAQLQRPSRGNLVLETET